MPPAPAVVRATRLLDFFARHPGQSFTLTQLAGVLECGLPSALAVLDALGAAGHVVRHPVHKTYALGPALVPVGEAAHVAHPVISVARDELEVLAGELHCECVAAVVVRDDIVFVARAGRSRSDSLPVRVGTRVPYRAPFGFVYVAWDIADVQQAWVRRAAAAPVTAAAIESAIHAVRDRGVCFAHESEARLRFMQLVQSDAVRPDAAEQGEADVATVTAELVGVNLEPEEHVVAAVSAPVFGAYGEVVLGVTAQGFAHPLDGAAAARVATQLRACTRTISRRAGLHSSEVGGRSAVASVRESRPRGSTR